MQGWGCGDRSLNTRGSSLGPSPRGLLRFALLDSSLIGGDAGDLNGDAGVGVRRHAAVDERGVMGKTFEMTPKLTAPALPLETEQRASTPESPFRSPASQPIA